MNDITDRTTAQPSAVGEASSSARGSSELGDHGGIEADSLLGDPPELEGFAAIRARLRSRLLDIDPSRVGSTPTPWGYAEDEPSPSRIGRYEVRALLGRGGMGVVYLAHDASLDRELAIKLLRADPPRATPEEQVRLRREARAMARLSHPNVVTVHEVDEHEGRLFIAMEYVKGLSLTDWLGSAHRPWQEVLEVLLAAGDGLAAAHAAGIVHRDFKPDNILVGDDGRVRVADFGLAWTGGGPCSETAPTEPIAVDGSESEEGRRLRETRTGTILGTLAYMAPEQYRGEAPSFAADQFSFSAALYRALYGHLPFDASSAALYQIHVRAGDVRPEPAGVSLPHWLRAAILRGLDADKAKRWESLDAFLRALRRSPRVPRWAPTVALACLVVGGIATLGTLSLVGREAPTLCRPTAEVLAGVWDSETRSRLAERFSVGGAQTDEARAWRTVDVALGLYSDRWAIEHTRACQALSLARGDAVATRALACLDDQREQFAALVVHLEKDGFSDLAAAVLLATGLPAPEICQQSPSASLHAGEAGLIFRTRHLAARRRLARASTDIDLHRLAAARSTIEDVLEIADELDSPGLEAEALLALGRAQRADHELDQARASLERARARVLGRPEAGAVELRILIQLVDVIGVGLGDLTEAEAAAQSAAAISLRLGNPSLLEAYLANNLARVHRAHRRYDDAESGYLNAYTLLSQTLGESAPETIAVRVNLGVVMSLQARPEAIAVLEHALEQQLSIIGEFHPRTPSILRNLGNALGRQGSYARAEGVVRHAIRLRERLHGEGSPELRGDLLSLSRVLRGLSRLDEADETLARAESLRSPVDEQLQASLRRERLALDKELGQANTAQASADG